MEIITKVVLLLSTLSTFAAYITSHTGTNVTFNWTLPEVAREERWLKFAFGNIIMFEVKTSSLVVPSNSSRVWHSNSSYNTRVQVSGFKPSELLLTFVLHNVTREDAGMYVCKDSKTDNIPGCEKLLIVKGKPTKPEMTAVKESSAVILSCTSNSTSLPVNHGLKMSYDWRQNNQLILRDNHILTVDQVKTNGMKYSCRAREDGDLESVWSEEQYGPDKVNIDPDIKVIDVMEGDPLTVTCSADCNPHCQVVWLNQDRSVDGNTPTLHWAKTNRTLAGVYTCEVNNIFGRQTRDIIVNVQYAPLITSFTVNRRMSSLTVRENHSVRFECTVEGYPQPNVSFVSLPNHDVMSSGFSSSYQINSVKCSHYGRYQCQASNGIQTTTSETVDLKVICGPKLHMLVKVLPAAWNISIWSYPKPHLTDFYFNDHRNIVRLDLSNKKYNIVLWDEQENLHGYTFDIINYKSTDEGTYIFTFDNMEEKGNISLQVGEIADPGPSLHGSSAAITIAAGTSVLIVLVAVIAAVFIYRYKKRAGERYRVPYECGDDTDDENYLYARVDKSRRPVTDVYATVKKTRPPPNCGNRRYMSGEPVPENQALIHDGVEDGMSGTANNNCGEQNAEGLNYADLDLLPPTMENGRPVIRCSEEPVLYEQIDFTRTPGPQLPEKIWEKEMKDQ